VGEPPGSGGGERRAGPLDDAADGTAPDLDLAFDSGTLSALRAKVKAYALLVGLAEARAADVVLAVHELAANTVCHGGGAGRLRIWNLPGALCCQVEDGESLAASQGLIFPLAIAPGHGLWVARQVADQMQVLSGPRGTCATVTFDLPPADG
jgi:anti-sigma regulatory factor (Ser/Thr protein kinase)